MKKFNQALLLSMAIGCAGTVFGYQPNGRNVSFLHRDTGYEEKLRDQAGIDKMLTPARAIRWLMSAMGHPLHSGPSIIEFRPIVSANESNTRIIAAFQYKFE